MSCSDGKKQNVFGTELETPMCVESTSAEVGRFSENLGNKGINGRRLEWQRQLEEEDNIIVKWAQEDVETLRILLNK